MPTAKQIELAKKRARKRAQKRFRKSRTIVRRLRTERRDGRVRKRFQKIWIIDEWLDETNVKRWIREAGDYYRKGPRELVFANLNLERFIPFGSPGAESLNKRGRWVDIRVQTRVVQLTKELRENLRDLFEQQIENGPEKGRLVILHSMEVEKFDVI